MRALRILLSGGLLTSPLAAGKEDPDSWQGSGNVGLTLATGNSESLRATVGLDVTRAMGTWESRAAASVLFGEDDGVSSTERFEGSLQLNRPYGERIYAGLTGEFLSDRLAGISWRLAMTPLLGWRVVDSERLKLRLEAGPGYTWEGRNAGDRAFSSVRLHERLSFQMTEETRIFQSLTSLLAAENPGNFTLTAEAGIESKLVGRWSLRLAGKAVYYGESQGRESGDLLLMAGFGYNHLPADQEEESLGSALAGLQSEEGRWAVTALLGGSFSRGNSEASSLNTGLKLKRKEEGGEFAAGFFGSYAERKGAISAETLAADARYQRDLRNQWFAGLRGDFDHDELADLEWRVALTPYSGWLLHEGKGSKLAMEGGPSVVAEQQGGSENTFLGVYAALKGEHKLGQRTRLFAELSWLGETTDWKSCFITSEVGIEHALSDRFSLKVIGRNAYDSSPATGRRRHDFQLVSALGVTF